MSRHGGTGSELCIGCMDSNKFTGEIDYLGLDPSVTNGTQFYWNVPSTGVIYNNTPVGTTFSAIYVAPDIAAALYIQIPGSLAATEAVGQGFYTYPCSATLGTISIGFGSKQYAIDVADFGLGQASPGSPDCVGGIVGRSVGSGLAILGDEFMKNVYSVFDYGSMQVGFAALTSN
ncbi:hypothetical protein FRB97_005979 [Tulasnella sp. 331]|nr:hypothetical protein FRB97_005979 [Tulasnella sp. 331]